MTYRPVLSLVSLLVLAAPAVEATAAPPRTAPGERVVVVTAKVTEVDAAHGRVLAEDQEGDAWELIAPPGSGVSLSRVKVGDTYRFTATAAPGTKRAKLSKVELIKL